MITYKVEIQKIYVVKLYEHISPVFSWSVTYVATYNYRHYFGFYVSVINPFCPLKSLCHIITIYINIFKHT